MIRVDPVGCCCCCEEEEEEEGFLREIPPWCDPEEATVVYDMIVRKMRISTFH
jgi:hypothetical protein